MSCAVWLILLSKEHVNTLLGMVDGLTSASPTFSLTGDTGQTDLCVDVSDSGEFLGNTKRYVPTKHPKYQPITSSL